MKVPGLLIGNELYYLWEKFALKLHTLGYFYPNNIIMWVDPG
jgi:hypothetical protein